MYTFCKCVYTFRFSLCWQQAGWICPSHQSKGGSWPHVLRSSWVDCRSAFSTVEKQEETESLWMFGGVIMLYWLIPTFLETQPEELKDFEVRFHLLADNAGHSNGRMLSNHCLIESLQSDICFCVHSTEPYAST